MLTTPARLNRYLAIIVMLLGAVGCATSPDHPALQSADLPRLIPVRQFVANTDFTASYQVSPDGRQLVHEGVSLLRPAIRWQLLDDVGKPAGKSHAVRFRKRSPHPFWSADSRYILYHSDPTGREFSHVYAIDTQYPSRPARDLTPHDGVTAFVQHIPDRSSNLVFVNHNRRDRAVFDLYSINLDTGKETLLFENDSNVLNTLVGDQGDVRARVRQTDSHRHLEIPGSAPGSWSTLLRFDRFDTVHPISLSRDEKALYIISNLERDKMALMQIQLDTGEQTLIYEHPDVDLQRVFMSRSHRVPLAIRTEPDYPQWHFLDSEFETRLQQVLGISTSNADPDDTLAAFNIISTDRSEQRMTIARYDHTGVRFELADLRSGERHVLAENAIRKNADVWVRSEPIELSARDGLTIHGYLSRPAASTPAPTVLLVHGGPWARDGWGFDQQTQFLVNRGYAVLRINYRGSAGYGKQFMFAGEGEFAGKMHTDLIDSLDWAIDSGITDPDRVGIMGGSYGGYATLVGMTMTPERFQCGIDIVGVSDLALLLETAPPYWKPFEHLWDRFIGDPDNPDDRRIMDSKSPVNFADRVRGPLLILHGVNDPRVVLEHSDRMVAALESAGKSVEYVVIDDEGHGFMHWKHQMTLYRKTEDFFARCLGGRSGGLDFFQLGSWLF